MIASKVLHNVISTVLESRLNFGEMMEFLSGFEKTIVFSSKRLIAFSCYSTFFINFELVNLSERYS